MKSKHQRITPSGTWILVADCGRARILSHVEECPDDVSVVKSLECPDSRLQTHEQVSDQPGYFRGRAGSLDAGDPETDFKHRQAQRFSREIVKELERGRQHGAFGRLILVAAPMLLGVLKSQLNKPLELLVDRSIDKDYTALSCEEIIVRL